MFQASCRLAFFFLFYFPYVWDFVLNFFHKHNLFVLFENIIARCEALSKYKWLAHSSIHFLPIQVHYFNMCFCLLNFLSTLEAQCYSTKFRFQSFFFDLTLFLRPICKRHFNAKSIRRHDGFPSKKMSNVQSVMDMYIETFFI